MSKFTDRLRHSYYIALSTFSGRYRGNGQRITTSRCRYFQFICAKCFGFGVESLIVTTEFVMSKSNDLWSTVVKEGLNSYDTQLGHARISTLVLIGAPKSVTRCGIQQCMQSLRDSYNFKFIFREKPL